MAAATSHTVQDIQRLSKVLLALFVAGIVLAAVGLVFSFWERAILLQISGLADGTIGSDAYDAVAAAADQSDLRQMILGWTQMTVGVITIILFLRWAYVATRNCHAASGKPLPFSPAWSIGWFFVPIANLWKPYQAMRQTWNVSEDINGDPERPAPGLLITWWLVFLLSSSIDRAALRQALKAEEISELLTSNIIMILTDAVGIPATILAWLVVRNIARLQDANFKTGIQALSQEANAIPA